MISKAKLVWTCNVTIITKKERNVFKQKEHRD